MAWFRLEDSFHPHPKVLKAGNAAVGLWVRCGTWSSEYLTDGLIPDEIVQGMGRTREVDAAITARLWVAAEGGLLMPDYLDFNPAGSEVKQRRKRDAERKREERARGASAVDHGADGRFIPHRQP